MLSQRVTLGIGLAILLLISGASIGMDVEARSDAARVDHTLDVLNKISDLRRLIRGAESASRGYALTSDQAFVDEFRKASAQVPGEFTDLLAAVSDNPRQAEQLRGIQGVVDRRLAVLAELLRLHTLGDSAAIAELISRAEGRAVMALLTASFDQMTAEERELLAVRRANSKTSGSLLLGVDLAGVVLILILAFILIRGAYLSRRKLEDSLSATQAVVQAHQEKVQHSTSVLESTFNSMAEAVFVIDAKGAVVLSNPAATQMLGYEPGMTIADLWVKNTFCRPDGVTPLTVEERPSTTALRGEPVDRREIIVRPVGGGKPVHAAVSSRPMRDAAGEISGASIVFHDITDIQDIERKLHQAQKLEAIGKLTGGVAHDFNNMLTVIAGTTEVLIEELADRPEAQQTAALINQAADRCTELIQHLLAFARRQPLRPRDVDINSVVHDITQLLRPTLGEQIEIDSVLDGEVATAHVDSAQLANSLVNMAINARDAMPRGGKLLVETRKVVLDEAYARANPGVTPGPYVMLAVSDTGTGMPADVRDRVFEPFFTTKEVGKGSGLGLSMVYGFVQQSGGHIKIYSEEGHGTTIRLYLPPSPGAAEAPEAAPAPISVGDETILVVEDDELVRRFVIAELQSLGYHTVAACDGREALSHVDSGQAFDLLFTDVVMPGGLNGPQLADEVAKRRPGTRVLYTSAYTDNAIVHHGRLDKGVLLLSKPYRKAQLAQMVRLALGDGVEGNLAGKSA
jgi:PAS domain S-box-containing protein